MDTRRYKGSEEEISLLGFGCMRLPLVSKDSQEIDVEAARAMVKRAFAGGINYFDTAHGYHSGQSQPVMGEILSHYPRESFKLATKMPPWSVESEQDVHRIFDEQLKLCRVDYFDYYLIHNVAEEYLEKYDRCRIYDILKEKQREGKIRKLGFSFHATPELMEDFLAKYTFDFAQIQLNYVDWELQNAKRQYEILTGRGIPVIVMEPVRGGALANLSDAVSEVFEKANPAASPASWALRFAASLPNVLTVLSGMSTMEQLEENIATMSGFAPLTDGERATVAEALTAYRLAGTIPCTACGYCMECPFGVNIPGVFGTYNEYRKNKSALGFFVGYRTMGKEKQAHNCISCGHCVPRCPQSIAIPAEMLKIAGVVETLRTEQ